MGITLPHRICKYTSTCSPFDLVLTFLLSTSSKNIICVDFYLSNFLPAVSVSSVRSYDTSPTSTARWTTILKSFKFVKTRGSKIVVSCHYFTVGNIFRPNPIFHDFQKLIETVPSLLRFSCEAQNMQALSKK